MKKIFISTAIDYPSEKPHLGHSLEKIQADVLARYKRLQGFDVHFSVGVDEHGLKIQRCAKQAGQKPQEFVDKISRHFRKLWLALNISNDDFIRTSEERHVKVVQEIFQKIYNKGDVYKGEYEGLYCVGCETYYLSKDLKEGRCSIHQRPVEKMKEESYFFKMSKYQKQLLAHIKKNKNFIVPSSKRNEILSRLSEPIQDLSISRKTVRWGIPLPIDESLTLFVWIDALINYLTTIDYPNNRFNEFWPADIHMIGKDIVWHHSVIWGSLLLSLGLPLPKTIFVHGFISSGGHKMSKSLGNVIDPFEIIEKYGADALRYFLLKEIPTTGDGDFTYERFNEIYNADLASGLGNLLARTLKMVEKYCDGKVPQIKKDPETHPLRINKEIYNWKKAWKNLDKNIEKYQFHEALTSVWRFISEADKYIEENKPWVLAKEEKAEELNWVLYGLLDSIHQIAWMINPFLPETSIKIAKALNINLLLKENPNHKDSYTNIKQGEKINPIESLFPRIEK